MTKTRIDAKAFAAAAKLAAEIENGLALSTTRSDPSRFPKLTFPPPFPVAAVTAAVSPDSSYLFLKNAIDSAKSTLLLYIYDISAPYLLDLLAAAKQRGVKIRAMYDANSGAAAELAALKKVVKTARDVQAAPSTGARSVFTVCHQKFMVIDGKMVIVESANWAQSSVPEIETPGTFKKANREWFVRIDNATIADWYTKLFEADWAIPESAAAGAGEFADLNFDDVALAAATQVPGKLFPAITLADPAATLLPVVSPDNYLKEVKALLSSAKKSICLQQQYILAGKGVKDLLAVVAQRLHDVPNFDVRIIISATFPKNWDVTKKTLDAAGLLDRLRALNPKSFTHCHNKGVLVDGTAVVVSSTNWSENSLLRAREAGTLIRSAKIAQFYQGVFDLDWKEGVPQDKVPQSHAVLAGSDVLM